MGHVQALHPGHEAEDVAVLQVGQGLLQNPGGHIGLIHRQPRLPLGDAAAVGGLPHGPIGLGMVAHEAQRDAAAAGPR